MSEARPAWWRRVALPIWPALLAGLVFLPALRIGFLYDDIRVVVENRQIQDLSQIGTVLGYEPSRPLLNLTWALNYRLAGLEPWSWHLVNVLLHAGNALLVTGLFLWIATRLGRPDSRAVALLGGCLFATTPMAVETAAYVSSRSTALASFFALAALALAAPALESGDRRRLGAAFSLTLLALAVKEEALAIPLLLLLLDVVVVSRGRLSLTLSRLGRHAPFLGLIPLGLLARRALTGLWLPPPVLHRGQYLVTQMAEFPGYLLRALLPFDPALYREVPPRPFPPDLATAAWIAGAVALVGAALAVRARRPVMTLAVLWMAAGLLPSSSLVPLEEMVVDHRAYLGGAGVLLFVAWQLAEPSRRTLAVTLLVLLTARSLHYQWVLASPLRTWAAAVERAPRSVAAHRSLAEARAAAGDVAGAEQALRHALRLDPRDVRSAVNLGVLFLETRRYDEAVRAFRAAARLAPEDARIRDNLGMLLLAMRKPEAARTEFEAAVRGQPALAQPRINLARLLIQSGEPARATQLLDEAAGLEIDPSEVSEIEALRAALR